MRRRPAEIVTREWAPPTCDRHARGWYVLAAGVVRAPEGGRVERIERHDAGATVRVRGAGVSHVLGPLADLDVQIGAQLEVGAQIGRGAAVRWSLATRDDATRGHEPACTVTLDADAWLAAHDAPHPSAWRLDDERPATALDGAWCGEVCA